jgi:histidine ammonia-lyase
MGSNAATKLWKVCKNTERVLAIELMNSAQALEFRHKMSGLNSSKSVEAMFEAYRKVVPFVADDTVMYPHIATSVNFLNDYELTR